MKIVYNLLEAVNSGGIERIVIAKANWLSEHGHDVTIITTDRKGRSPFFPINDKIRSIDLGINYRDSWGSTLKKLALRPRLMHRHREELSRVLKQLKPHISVSTFGNEVEFLTSIPEAGHTVAEIHFSRMFRLNERSSGLQGMANRIHTVMDKRLAAKYDAFVCLTEEDKPAWGTLPNINVIPNFIMERSPSMAAAHSQRAIAVGRLTRQKGYDQMIEAWKTVTARHPDWCLDIYGDGELKEALLSQINTLGLSENIIIHPTCSPIESKMLGSEFLLMTSLYEGLPMVMLEAMGCGLPVVTFDFKCGPRDIIGNRNGLVVPYGNIAAFADSICRLIEDHTLRDTLAANSYESSLEFTQDRIMPHWITLFNRLAAE